MQTEIKLGARYKDKVSGFIGVAIGATTWLNGCQTIGLRPPIDKDGKLQEAIWIDAPQIEYVEDVVAPGPQTTGGPKPTPQRNTNGG